MRGRIIILCAALTLALVASGCTLIDSGTNTPVPPAPTVEFLFPSDNTTVLEGTDLQIEILARDDGAGVARVELSVDDLPHQQGEPVERESIAVFTVAMNWIAQGVGLHTLTATAYRADGTASTPVTVRINVIAAPA